MISILHFSSLAWCHFGTFRHTRVGRAMALLLKGHLRLYAGSLIFPQTQENKDNPPKSPPIDSSNNNPTVSKLFGSLMCLCRIEGLPFVSLGGLKLWRGPQNFCKGERFIQFEEKPEEKKRSPNFLMAALSMRARLGFYSWKIDEPGWKFFLESASAPRYLPIGGVAQLTLPQFHMI